MLIFGERYLRGVLVRYSLHCHSHGYYWHSVTIGLAPLRRSRIPLALDVSSVT